MVESNDCGVGGAVDSDAVDAESIGGGVRGIDGGGNRTVHCVGDRVKNPDSHGLKRISSKRPFG